MRSYAEQGGRLQRHLMISSKKGKHWPQPWQEREKGKVPCGGNCWKSTYHLIFTRWGGTPSQVNRVRSKRQGLVTSSKGLCGEDQCCFQLSGDCSCLSQSHLRCFKLWKHFGVSKWVPCNHRSFSGKARRWQAPCSMTKLRYRGILHYLQPGFANAWTMASRRQPCCAAIYVGLPGQQTLEGHHKMMRMLFMKTCFWSSTHTRHCAHGLDWRQWGPAECMDSNVDSKVGMGTSVELEGMSSWYSSEELTLLFCQCPIEKRLFLARDSFRLHLATALGSSPTGSGSPRLLLIVDPKDEERKEESSPFSSVLHSAAAVPSDSIPNANHDEVGCRETTTKL